MQFVTRSTSGSTPGRLRSSKRIPRSYATAVVDADEVDEMLVTLLRNLSPSLKLEVAERLANVSQGPGPHGAPPGDKACGRGAGPSLL
jgi:hypothetical protein